MFLKFLIQYVKHIDKQQFKTKTNKSISSRKDFILYYYRSLKQLSKSETEMLYTYVKERNHFKYGLEHLNSLLGNLKNRFEILKVVCPIL